MTGVLPWRCSSPIPEFEKSGERSNFNSHHLQKYVAAYGLGDSIFSSVLIWGRPVRDLLTTKSRISARSAAVLPRCGKFMALHCKALRRWSSGELWRSIHRGERGATDRADICNRGRCPEEHKADKRETRELRQASYSDSTTGKMIGETEVNVKCKNEADVRVYNGWNIIGPLQQSQRRSFCWGQYFLS